MISTFLVTGGAGFIGSNIVADLLRRGEKVRVFDNFSTGKHENIKPFKNDTNFELIEGDLRNIQLVRTAVKGVDFVLHQGALPSVPRSINDPLSTNEVNIVGTLNVLEAAKEFGVHRVIYASSSSVYGDNEEFPKVEDMPIRPLSPYALTKYAGEKYCQLYFKLYGLQTVCLRYFNVFGPNQDPSSHYSAVIPKFITAIMNGKQPVIYGDGLQSRDFTYVANNVEANLLACYAAEPAVGNVINIACGERITLLDLVKTINEFTGKYVQPVYEKQRAGDVKHSLASIEKAKDLLRYHVKYSFIEGLRETIDFFSRSQLN